MKPKVSVDSLIVTVRGERVLLASDLAVIYGVETRALNQAARRNSARFPSDFAFRLTPVEFEAAKAQGLITAEGRAASRSQTVILNRGQNSKYPPVAFTEHGAIMAASVLNSPAAVAMSVFVVRAFVQMRERLAANAAILKRLAEIDTTLIGHDQALRAIWLKLQPLLEPPPAPPQPRIGFHRDRPA